ncbi:hypothetical protein Tco_0797337 [Tanacetum coccineum]
MLRLRRGWALFWSQDTSRKISNLVNASQSSFLKKSCSDSRVSMACSSFLILHLLIHSFDMQQIAASLEDKMTIKMKQMMNEMKALVVTTPTPVKAVEEAFRNELAPLDSLPPGNDDLTLKKDLENFQVYSNPLFEFDDNFKSSSINPLFDKMEENVEIKNSNEPVLLNTPLSDKDECFAPEDNNETPMFFSLVRFVWKMMTQIAIRKKIICLLAAFLHKKPKPLSHPKEVSSDVPINTIVMPIRITFDNPIDFTHFSKPKDLKKDLAVAFDSTESSILPPPLLDSDSPFTAELSASITLNSLRNEDKVFKPGILVYHAIHDKNLVTMEENLKENISSGTLLFFKEPSFPRPPPEPPDVEKCFEPEAGILITKVFKGVSKPHDFMADILPTLPTLVSDLTFISSFFSFMSENFVFDPGIVTFLEPVAFSMAVSCSKIDPTISMNLCVTVDLSRSTRASHPLYGYIKNHKKTVKISQARTQDGKEYTRAGDSKPKPRKVNLRSTTVKSTLKDKIPK